VKRLAIIACGSRNWVDEAAVFRSLDVMRERRLDLVIHGASRGADLIACEWARLCNVQRLALPAQWDRDGKSAGPIRNAAMLTILQQLESFGYDIEVHGWPLGESRGTRHMMKIASDAGVTVVSHALGARSAVA
jgi:hypothetical protein